MPTVPSTKQIGAFLDRLLPKRGELTVVSGDLAQKTGAETQRAKVCGVMYKRMRLGDEVLASPDSGTGKSLTIVYRRPALTADKTATVLMLIDWLRD